uniref:C-type lectin domain-containing protein n=1 Tax=Poecilia formosa TaxID=48698 RepID=A0A096LXE4_POEFO
MEKFEVEKQNESVQKTHDTTVKEAERLCRYQQLCCCFGILCVISVLCIIGVCVYYYKNLMIQFDNLTTASITLEKNRNLTLLNEKLMEERKKLTELIKNMEETWNELNARSCTSCQRGWNYQLSSCYAYNDAEYAYRTNWNGARENCKKMNSDLTVVSDNAEKIYVKTLSPVIGDITGYWIGLRAVGGKWKWLDGSDLTNQAWIQQPATDGQCVTSLQTREWTSVSCTEKYNWICEKKALSV